MSRTTKRKHVLKEILDDDYDSPKPNQTIVRVVGSRGNNLHEIETADDVPQNYLVTMPTKFRKNVWIKRGDYVIVEPIDEGDKVKAEIIRILTPEHIKIFTKDGLWPKKFTKKREHEESDDDDDLFKNTNRNHLQSDDEQDDSENTTESDDN